MEKNEPKAASFDSKELELPETVYVRDIENRVIQAFILQSLSKIQGVSLLEGNFIDNILGRDTVEHVRGINVQQDSRSHSVGIKVEVNICYGLSIPEKAQEIQEKIAEEVTTLTGLHVSCVHVIFKNVILDDPNKRLIDQNAKQEEPQGVPPVLLSDHLDDEFTEEF